MSCRILSVDWDFFFPIPYDTPEVMMYDWGHRETPFFSCGIIWDLRAASFTCTGRPLPLCQRWERFAQRFKFSPGAQVFLAEHHAMAIQLVAGKFLPSDVTEIVSYDAHHDCGYGPVPDTGEIVTTTDEEGRVQVDSENWLGIAIKHYGIRAEVVYPDWKDGRKIEGAPQIEPADWSNDKGLADWHHFDAVLLCRSGVWVPPWCDEQWALFTDTWPKDMERVYLESEAGKMRDTGVMLADAV